MLRSSRMMIVLLTFAAFVGCKSTRKVQEELDPRSLLVTPSGLTEPKSWPEASRFELSECCQTSVDGVVVEDKLKFGTPGVNKSKTCQIKQFGNEGDDEEVDFLREKGLYAVASNVKVTEDATGNLVANARFISVANVHVKGALLTFLTLPIDLPQGVSLKKPVATLHCSPTISTKGGFETSSSRALLFKIPLYVETSYTCTDVVVHHEGSQQEVFTGKFNPEAKIDLQPGQSTSLPRLSLTATNNDEGDLDTEVNPEF